MAATASDRRCHWTAEEALEVDELKAFKKPKEEIILVAQCVPTLDGLLAVRWWVKNCS